MPKHSYLGLHHNGLSDLSLYEGAAPRLACVLLNGVDPARLSQLVSMSPGTFVVGRYVLPQDNQPLDNPIQNARAFYETALPYFDRYRYWLDAVVGYNEPGVGGKSEKAVETLKRYVEFELERVRLMEAEGFRCGVLTFSSGVPEPESMEYCVPVLRNPNVIFCVHEYSEPTLWTDAGWQCLRHRKLYEALPRDCWRPLAILECGIDGGVHRANKGGWRDYTDAASYMAQLQWYDEELARSVEMGIDVIGAAIYCSETGADHKWNSFNVQGDMTPLLRSYITANPAPSYRAHEGDTKEEPMSEDKTLTDLLAVAFGEQYDDIRAVLPTNPNVPPYSKRDLSRIQYAVIHHTDTPSETMSRAIAEYHIQPKPTDPDPWPGIGYHFLIHGVGTWGKVRYCGDLDTSRYHVGEYNPVSIGIALVGDFTSKPPPDLQIELAWRLCEALDRYLGRKLMRVGHRDLNQTACPGATADAWLPLIIGTPEKPDAPDEQGDPYATLAARVTALEEQQAVITKSVEQLTVTLPLETIEKVTKSLREAAAILEGL